jgi:hypothetical protein
MAEFVQKRKFLITVFLLAMALCNLAVPFQGRSGLRNGYQDFTIYYMSGLLLRNSQAPNLYNLSAQYRTQLTFAHVPIRQGPLPYNHPPFEALLFVPFTLLAYWPAYLLWTALNLAMLALSVIILRRQFRELALVSPLILGLGAIAFFPAVIGIFQGQDVILLELLFVLAMVSLNQGKDARAGAFLAAGLFLPHLVMPVVVLFAVRRWRVLVGFAPVTLLLAIVSVLIMGWRGPLDYLQFVLHVEKSGSTSYGPQVAPNLRGLIADLPGLNSAGPWTALLIFAASVVVFFVALRRIHSGRDSMLYLSSLTAVTTILISFHALSYDLTLLLPAALWFLSKTVAAEPTKPDAATMMLFLLLFLSPLYVFLLIVAKHFFWFSLILLWLYMRLVMTSVPAKATS